jgi:amino acid transporter
VQSPPTQPPTAAQNYEGALASETGVPPAQIFIDAAGLATGKFLLLVVIGAFILGLPYLWNATAYAAVTSIAVIGLYIAYVLPTFLRLRQGDEFKRGPWHLGRWSRLVGTIAVAWVCFITVLFMLPQVYPVTAKTFNYTPVAVLVVLGFAGIWWMLSARRWFKGPKVQGTADELAAIERDLDSVA